jgi:hypothetical protein
MIHDHGQGWVQTKMQNTCYVFPLVLDWPLPRLPNPIGLIQSSHANVSRFRRLLALPQPVRHLLPDSTCPPTAVIARCRTLLARLCPSTSSRRLIPN